MAASGFGAGFAQPKTGVPVTPDPVVVTRATTSTKPKKTEEKSEES